MRLLCGLPAAGDPGEHPGARERIFSTPSGTAKEAEFREDWRAYVQPDLAHLFASARETVEEDLATLRAELDKLDSGTGRGVDEEQATLVSLAIPRKHLEAWLSALNQARLVLAEQHGIGEKEINVRLEKLAEEQRLRALLHLHFSEVVYHLLLETPASEPERGMLSGHFGNVLRHLKMSVDPPLTSRDEALLRINFYDVLQQLVLREMGFGG